MTKRKIVERKRWTEKEVSVLKSTGSALAKKLHRSPASIGIRFYNLTAPGRKTYFAKLKGKKAKSSKSKKTVRSTRKSLGVNKKTLRIAKPLAPPPAIIPPLGA